MGGGSNLVFGKLKGSKLPLPGQMEPLLLMHFCCWLFRDTAHILLINACTVWSWWNIYSPHVFPFVIINLISTSYCWIIQSFLYNHLMLSYCTYIVTVKCLYHWIGHFFFLINKNKCSFGLIFIRYCLLNKQDSIVYCRKQEYTK